MSVESLLLAYVWKYKAFENWASRLNQCVSSISRHDTLFLIFFQCTAGLILCYVMRFFLVLFAFEREGIFQIWSSTEINWNYYENFQLSAALHSVLKTKTNLVQNILNQLTSHALVLFFSLSLHVKAKFCDYYLLVQYRSYLLPHIHTHIHMSRYKCINAHILVCVYKNIDAGRGYFYFL